MKLKKGMVQVYTGSGKGKTTAAWGQALRASGQGLRVAIVQFFKGKGSGEAKMARKSKLAVYFFCPVHPFFGGKREKLEKECREGLIFAKKIIMSKKYDLVILDEIIIAMKDRLIEINEVLDLIKKKPGGVELILTGRGAPKKITKHANLVTEMREIKHPYQKGIKGRKGIEY